MLDLKLITENPELVKARLAKKGCVADFTEVLKLDAERKELMAKIEALKAERNKVSAEIPKLKKEGKIRIGNYMSPYVDISEFDTMDKYSFEYIKKHNERK